MKNERKVKKRCVDQVYNGGDLRADDRQFVYDLVWAATYALASHARKAAHNADTASPELVVREFERLVEQQGHFANPCGTDEEEEF